MRCDASGEMTATIVTYCSSLKSFAIWAMRLIFSLRSGTVKLRSAQIPVRNSSPSSTMAFPPFALIDACKLRAIVDFPAPDNPVNQITGDTAPSRYRSFEFI